MSDPINILDISCAQEVMGPMSTHCEKVNVALEEMHYPYPTQDSQKSHKIPQRLVISDENMSKFENDKLAVEEHSVVTKFTRGKRQGRKETRPQKKSKTNGERQMKSISSLNTHIADKQTSFEELKPMYEERTETDDCSRQDTVDNSLGETLATSLKLIATNSSSPPHPSSLLEQSYKEDALNYTQDAEITENHTKDFQSSQVPTMAPTQPLTKWSPCLTRSGAKKKKRGRKPKKIIPPEDDLDDKYISDSEMMQPVLHNDGSVTLYQCEVCHKLFNKRQTLRQHFITHTDRFACQFCDARCKSKGDLRTHIQTHTKEKPYHCDICNTDYTRESILKKHLKTQLHLRAVYERDKIVEMHRFRGSKDMKAIDKFIPSKTKVKLGGFSCGKCSRVLLTKTEYRKHIKSHSMTHVCNVCQKGCKTALLLKIHLRSHKNENKLSCKSCSRKFATLQFLKDHLKTHKDMSTQKPDQSLIKAVITKHNKDIKMMKVSELQDPPQPKGRQPHTPVSRKATFECKICHRMFTSEKRLSNHAHTHKGLFPCSVCTKSFASSSKLTNHMLEHEKLFVKCEICHAAYGNQDQLNRHVESQHCEGSELVCKICYKKFESAIEVHRHMNDHAPTMLFSGGCLDESSIPVVNRGKRVPHSLFYKITDTDDSSDEEKKFSSVAKIVNEFANHKQSLTEEDGDGNLTTSEFIEIMNTALEMDDKEVYDNETPGFEDELFFSIFEVLESEIHSSGESDFDEDYEGGEELSAIRKPILYCYGDIVRKHGEEFEQYCHKDISENIFQCALCVLNFDKEKYLSNHIKSHVCEYCNKFFTDTGKLSIHKASHVKRLLSKIDSEAKKMQQTRKWQNIMIDSSDSETENDVRFLNDLEDILESDSAKSTRAEHFLRTLSHDDIVKANKHVFDEHSFVDTANNIFACTICKRKYARPTTLTRHFKTHVCQYCNTFFTDKSDLLEHKYRHRKRAALMKAEITGEGSKMPPSPVVSKENRALFKRFSFVDAERNINRCTLCSKDFVRRTVLTRHLKTHVCAHCDKFFEDKYDLVKHTTFHKVEKQYTEEDGDDEGEDFLEYEDPKPFPQASPQEQSLREKTLSIPSSYPSTLPPYNSSFHVQPSCTGSNEPIAYIQLPSAGNVGADNQVYPNQNNGTPFQIIPQTVNVYKENGSDSFLVSSTNCQPNNQDKIITITQPQMVQDDAMERERLFECGECGKRFFKNGHLKSHMTIHTGSRPHVCSVCGKAFSRGTTLRKHEKTHLKRCKICDTTFASKYELDLHLEIHRTYAFYK